MAGSANAAALEDVRATRTRIPSAKEERTPGDHVRTRSQERQWSRSAAVAQSARRMRTRYRLACPNDCSPACAARRRVRARMNRWTSHPGPWHPAAKLGAPAASVLEQYV